MLVLSLAEVGSLFTVKTHAGTTEAFRYRGKVYAYQEKHRDPKEATLRCRQLLDCEKMCLITREAEQVRLWCLLDQAEVAAEPLPSPAPARPTAPVAVAGQVVRSALGWYRKS